jgi:peptidoglycan/LPS O-acetylase OafA/YrhL
MVLAFAPRRFIVPSLCVWLVALPFWEHFTFMGNPARADLRSGPIAMGCLLALIDKRPSARVGAALVAVGSVIGLLVPSHGLHGHGMFILASYAWNASLGAIVLGAVAGGMGPLDCAPLRWVGRLSYSLYLWQQLWVYLHTLRPWALGTWPLCLVPMAACGILSYYAVERPMLRLRDARRVLAPA